MDAAVVVPFRGGCPYRERAWEHVQSLYAERHTGWEVIEASAPAGEWIKAAATNPAIEAIEAEVIIQADADCWTDGLQEAVAAVEAGAPWAIPHLMINRLSEEATERVLAGADWQDQPLAQPPYRGIPGGGCVIASREVLRAVPLDRRFIGWGQEDEAHAIALRILAGEPWRGTADLLHLFHPPQQRMTRRRGSQESWALRRRYGQCKNDPAAMAALVEEGRRAGSTHADPYDHHPAPAG